MKLKGIKILTFLIAVFGFIGIANAGIKFPETGTCANPVSGLDQNCELSFKVTGASVPTGTEFVVGFSKANNIANNGDIVINATEGFVILDDGVEKDEKTIRLTNGDTDEVVNVTFKYTGSAALPASDTNIVFANAIYTIISGDVTPCGFNYAGYLAGLCKKVTSNNIDYYYGTEAEYLGTGAEAETAYYKACFSCSKPGDTNKYTGIKETVYHGLDGKETTEEKYNEECNPTYVCKIDKDGNYYGPEGTKVTEDEFYKLCYSCKKDEDGKYRGLDGKETTEEEFLKQCYSCKKDDEGKYHDKEGKVITEEEYKKICEPTCRYEKKDGKYVYYDFDGKEISKEEYAKICPGDVPTGSFLPIAGIIGGIALIGFASFLVKKQTKIKNI